MLVLRSDISQKLRSVRLLLINLKIFNDQADTFEYGLIWDRNADQIKDDMNSLGVEVIGYRSDNKFSVKTARKHGVKDIIIKGNKKKELLKKFEREYSFKDILLVGAEITDVEIAGLSRFSAATASSPLELKMESDYVSNFSGINAYQEIGNLIINAKGPY